MKYLSYQLFLEEPLRIVELDASKEGEWDTLSYIPGSTIRGAVLNKLSDVMQDPMKKRMLLSDKYMFLNAYPLWNKKVFYPSVKGFYEGKIADGNLQNVLCEEKPQEGFKRAGLGMFCHIEGDTIFYGNVAKKDVLGIHVEQKNIFRSLALEAHQRFQGYILVADELEEEEILAALGQKTIRLGSGKTSGYGKCRIENIGHSEPEHLVIKQEKLKEVFMVLCSNMSMKNKEGEVCGVDTEGLAKLLDIDKVTVEKASTSIVKMSGVNRTWGCRTPEITMYQAGSVFKLAFSEPVAREKLRQAEESGIGINRQEGCGRICFTDQYLEIRKKELVEQCLEPLEGLDESDRESKKELLKMAARKLAGIQIEEKMLQFIRDDARQLSRKIAKSQYGILLNQTKNLRYTPDKVQDKIERYISHERDKLGRQKGHHLSANGKDELLTLMEQRLLSKNIWEVLKLHGSEVCGFPLDELFSSDEKTIMNLELLQREITYLNRKERGEDV